MFERAKYKEHSENSRQDWRALRNPAGTIKYDGANYWMPVSEDGSLSFISRRESVKGGFPDRTASLPHITSSKLPKYAGHTYNVELIHTGDIKHNVESHRVVSGILNSLSPRAIETQSKIGPVRVVLHNVVNPVFNFYRDKLIHLKEVEKAFNKPDLLWAAEPYTTHESIQGLIDATKFRGQEGVIVTSLTDPEYSNTRIKIKHKVLHNLRISKILQEYDRNGKPKDSMGSVEVQDASGRVVGNVGSGFTRDNRIDAWKNPNNWIGKIIQVESMGMAKNLLRMPIYNGDADGEVDLIA